jgi:hypothetical protein
MSKNINQVFMTNPITSNASTDLMYFGQSPYGATNDAAMTYANFALQFGAAYTASALTATPDTNVTITLGGTPATALLHAASITLGWTGQLSPARGGTGVNNGTSTFTVGGNFAMSGAFTFTGTLTGATAVTFPTSGTLATTSQLPTPAALTEANDTNVTMTLGGTPATALLQAVSMTLGWSGQLSLARGGTNAALTASNGGIFYSTASAGAILAGTATANQMLQSGASGAPAWSTATYPATTTINQILFSSAANTVTGLSTANSATILTSSTGVPSFSASMTNGQVLIGSTGASPAPAALTAGTGITITNAAHSITVSISGADQWVDETGASVTMATNTGYTSDDGATLVTFTLPTTSAIGDWVEINGKGAGLWKIAQASGQQIHIGTSATTSGATGSLASVNQFDNVRLRCLTANTIWTVVSQQSSGLTVV